MKLTITFIRLKTPLHFFALSASALQIITQLKTAKHSGFKKQGFWTKHYTMTLWENEEQLKNFASSGAHLEAMKNSKKIASEIRTITIDAAEFPDWTTAKGLLSTAKPIYF